MTLFYHVFSQSIEMFALKLWISFFSFWLYSIKKNVVFIVDSKRNNTTETVTSIRDFTIIERKKILLEFWDKVENFSITISFTFSFPPFSLLCIQCRLKSRYKTQNGKFMKFIFHICCVSFFFFHCKLIPKI